MNPMLLLYSVTAMAGAAPTVAAPAPAALRADSDSVLTLDALTRLEKFRYKWIYYTDARDDSSKLWARMQHYTDNDGIPRGSSWMLPSMRIPVGRKMEGKGDGGIMAKDSMVAADLKEIGLTPKQYQLYEGLYESATLTFNRTGKDEWTPVEAHNIKFLQEHLEFVCDSTASCRSRWSKK